MTERRATYTTSTPDGETRLADAWDAIRVEPDPPDVAGWDEWMARCDAAWEAYQAHVRECDECKGKVEK